MVIIYIIFFLTLFHLFFKYIRNYQITVFLSPPFSAFSYRRKLSLSLDLCGSQSTSDDSETFTIIAHYGESRQRKHFISIIDLVGNDSWLKGLLSRRKHGIK